jgi:ABC-type lipoprotein release transport system permease subunit
MWQLRLGFRLSYRYWQSRLGWLLGSTLSIAVTVGLAFGVSQLLVVTQTTYQTMVIRPLGFADAQLLATSDEGMFATWQTVLKKFPGLETLTPVLSRQTVAIFNEVKTSVQVRGIDPQTYFLLHPTLVLKGRVLLEHDTTSVMISRPLAQELGITVGNTLELVTPRGFRSYKVVGISDEALGVVNAPLSDIQALFTSGERVDGFDLRLSSSIHHDATLKETTLKTLQERFQTLAKVMTPSERVQPVREVLMIVRVVLLTLLGLSVVIMMCLIFNFLETTKTERRDEISALYKLGVARHQLTLWRNLELGLIFLTASLLGLLTAVIIAHQQTTDLNKVSFVVAALISLSVVATVPFFFWLRGSEKAVKSETVWGRVLPLKLWLSWQLLVQLGRSYWLAVLMITVALTGFTSIEVILQVQRRSLESLVTTLTNPSIKERELQLQEEFPIEGELSQTLRWNMAMMPGVAFVSSYLAKVTMEEKLQEDMYVLDFATFPYQSYLQSTEGVKSEALAEALSVERNLAISESLANSYDLQTGMGMNLRTPTGQHRYKIVAVLKDIGGVSRAIFIDRHLYLQDWGRSSEGLFLLSLEEEVRPQQVAGLVQEQLSQRYKGLSWRAASLKSDLEGLVAKLLVWCRWLMLLFIGLATMSLSYALSGMGLRELVSTLYFLGGQRRLMTQLSQYAVFITTSFVVMTAFTLGTGLSYWLVNGLQQSGSYWVWQLSGLSYALSLFIVLVFVVVLSKAMSKHVVAPPHSQVRLASMINKYD